MLSTFIFGFNIKEILTPSSGGAHRIDNRHCSEGDICHKEHPVVSVLIYGHDDLFVVSKLDLSTDGKNVIWTTVTVKVW